MRRFATSPGSSIGDPGNCLFSHGAHRDPMRRLMSPEGRNRTPSYSGATVAACPDDRASCPATEARPPSEESYALAHVGTAPVGKEADPTDNLDPPLTHRVPEGGATRSPVP